jgi:hypothetical protein
VGDGWKSLVPAVAHWPIVQLAAAQPRRWHDEMPIASSGRNRDLESKFPLEDCSVFCPSDQY